MAKPKPTAPTSNGQLTTPPQGALNGAAAQAAAPSRFLYPHQQGFQAVWQTPARTYRFTFDEALRRSRTDALAMRRDGHIISLLQARYLPVLGADWHIKADDDADVDRAKMYQALVEKTPRLLQLRKCLLEAVWFGRHGVQLLTGPVQVGGEEKIGIVDWKPINGDKIGWTYEGVPAIRINPLAAAKLKEEGANVLDGVGKGDARIHTAWNDVGTVLILDQPRYRDRFVIHVHEIEDADYTEPELAGAVGGVGLRHYCYWVWWLRQEVHEWLFNYLETMGAGGLTIVGFDQANPNGLEQAQEAFKERATIVYLPIPPGQDKQTNLVQRVEPSGTGNDIFTQWIDGYFNGILTRLIIGQDLSSKSGPTGLGSGVADLQADVKQCIHRYDARNLNETETQQLLNVLIGLNEPDGEKNLRCETVLKEADPDKALQAARQVFDMGGEIPESHARKMASIPEPKEGEKLLSQAQVQQEQAAAQAQAQGQPGATGDASGASTGQGQGIPLGEMRKYLDAQGIPEEDHLHHLADMVDSGELQEVDTDGGVQYLEQGQEAGEPEGDVDTGKPVTYSKEDWTEEQGPRGGRRWVNKKTGTVQYKEPGDGNTGPKDATIEEPAVKGDKPVAKLRKGMVAQGAYQYADKALRGESNKTLHGEGVLAHVVNLDKRLVKSQVVSLAAQHGMPVDTKTTKTRAMAYIEDKLRGHLAKGKGGSGGTDAALGNDATATAPESPAKEGPTDVPATPAGGVSPAQSSANDRPEAVGSGASGGGEREGARSEGTGEQSPGEPAGSDEAEAGDAQAGPSKFHDGNALRGVINQHGGDSGKAAQAMGKQVQDHLDQGGKVSLWMDGKQVNVAGVNNGRFTDDKGQNWGMVPLTMGTPGTKTGLEFHGAEQSQSSPQAPQQASGTAPNAPAATPPQAGEKNVGFDPKDTDRLKDAVAAKKGQPVAKAGAARPEGAKEKTAEQGKGEPKVTHRFTTAKGSTYTHHEDGTTTRNKAARTDYGHEGDSGAKERSAKTYYMDENTANALARPQGTSRVIDHGNGTLSVATKNANGQWGVAPSQSKVKVSDKPSHGAIPLELWEGEKLGGHDAYRTTHFGNKITELNEEPASPEKATEPQREPIPPDAPRQADESLKDHLKRTGLGHAHGHINGYAQQLHEVNREIVGEHNAALSTAMGSLKAGYRQAGKSESQLYRDLRKAKDGGDWTSIHGFDSAATAVASAHSGLFGAGQATGRGNYNEGARDFKAEGDVPEKLWGMLQGGRKPAPSLRDAEDQATDEYQDHHAKHVAASADNAEAGDDSFDHEQFGENEVREHLGEHLTPEEMPDTIDTAKESNDAVLQGHASESDSVESDGTAEGGAQSAEGAEDRGASGEDSAHAEGEKEVAGHPVPDDPLDLHAGNLKPAWEHVRDEIQATDQKMSPTMAGSLAAARIMNAVNERGKQFIADTDAKVKAGKDITDEEDAKYIAAGEARRNLYQPLVDLSGYRPHGTLDEHPEAKKPLKAAASAEERSDPSFMAPTKPGPHSADSMDSYAGQSFTSDAGHTVDVRKADDGTWSVGTKTGLSKAGAANHLNAIGAVKAKNLFGDEAQAQKDVEKPKEKLDWQAPSKPKEGAELPGMKDTFAPGMFGKAKTEKDAEGRETKKSADGTEWAKAKAGGEVSPVNGKHYAGGQWMPIHGLSEKVEKKPKGNGQGETPTVPDENAEQKAKRQPRSPMTPEQIEEERQKREREKKWDEMAAGPLGEFSWMGDHPNSKAEPARDLAKWKTFAEKLGEEKLKALAGKLEKAHHDKVDSQWPAGSTTSRHDYVDGKYQTIERPITDEERQEWKDEAKQFAKDDSTYHGMKGHLKKVPSSAYVRQLMLHFESPGDDRVDRHYKLHQMLRDVMAEQPKPSDAPPAPSPTQGAGGITSLTHAARELETLRNDRTMTPEQKTARVDAVGQYLATQKTSKLTSKLLQESHQLHEVIRGGSGKGGVQVEPLDRLHKTLGLNEDAFPSLRPMSSANSTKQKGKSQLSPRPERIPGEHPHIRTPEFKNWFGDWEKEPDKASKVVDGEGKPLVVYHGTWKDFDTFDTEGGSDLGSHFGSLNQASDFAKAEGGRMAPVFLNITNPLRLDDIERWDYDGVSAALAERGIKVETPKQEYVSADMATNFQHNIKLRRRAIADAMAAAGHDGIVYANKFEGGEKGKGDGADSYVAFRPNQIKSAIANRGTYSPTSKKLHYQRG